MKERDVQEDSAKAVEPTDKDLNEIAKHGFRVSDESQDGDDSQLKTPTTVPLTAAKISEWNYALEKIFNDMENVTPCLNAASHLSISPPLHLT
jgi:hypothetical protein